MEEIRVVRASIGKVEIIQLALPKAVDVRRLTVWRPLIVMSSAGTFPPTVWSGVQEASILAFAAGFLRRGHWLIFVRFFSKSLLELAHSSE
jgi:hypothetical protein